jgi:hypothetical protein
MPFTFDHMPEALVKPRLFPPFLSLIHILPVCFDSAQVLYDIFVGRREIDLSDLSGWGLKIHFWKT